MLADYLLHVPPLTENLTLRSGPLRDAWDARGPGMLGGITRETHERLIGLKADCLLVLPVAGGGGYPYLLYNSVRFEGMLANPHGELPEVVRLAWLLAQLNCDLPMFAEQIPPSHVPTIAAASMLLPTLAAAADVDLIRFSDELLVKAIEWWQVHSPVENLAAVLTGWWNAYVQSRPPWDVAVLELDRILFPVEGNGD
jgi:hypothetical protein